MPRITQTVSLRRKSIGQMQVFSTEMGLANLWTSTTELAYYRKRLLDRTIKGRLGRSRVGVGDCWFRQMRTEVIYDCHGLSNERAYLDTNGGDNIRAFILFQLGQR